MQTLKTLQVMARVLFVLAKLAMILLIAGAALCLVFGSLSLTVPSFVEKLLFRPEQDMAALGWRLIEEGIFLSADAILAGFSCAYYRNVIRAKTPFTRHGAKELLRHGILNLTVPLAALGLTALLFAIAGISSAHLFSRYETAVGVIMIFLSFLLRYGAELEEKGVTNR